MKSIIVHQDIDIHDSKMEPKGLNVNDNIAHLRTLEKALISKRMESQKEINKTTIILDNLYTQINGRKRKASRSKVASLEQSFKELRLAHKKINSDISELNR